MKHQIIDFFVADCAQLINNEEFWLSDKEGAPAYIHQKGNDESARVILVKNSKKRPIYFHPIDPCVLIPKSMKRCDCMLKLNQSVHFIELKNRKDTSDATKEWVSHGLEQISTTIEIFRKQTCNSIYIISTCYLANAKPFKQFYSNQLLHFNKTTQSILGHSVRIQLVESHRKPINL